MSGSQLEAEDRSIDAAATPAELRVTDALMRCVARWGLAKTTIEDIAREAGVSRATVYRLFPGGRSTIMHAAVRADVQRLLELLTAEAAQAPDVEVCLVEAMHHAGVFLLDHPALSFMRDHERAAIEQIMSFDRMDVLFTVWGTVMAPVLRRFLDDDESFATAIWAARLVVSYVSEPSTDVDLRDRSSVEDLVRTFMVPGLSSSRSRAPVDLRASSGPTPAPVRHTPSHPTSQIEHRSTHVHR
jgi:AcrR family transcriptional regulator